MPVDTFVCPKCGNIDFVQCMELHVAVNEGIVTLVEQAATPRFKCLTCDEIVTFEN